MSTSTGRRDFREIGPFEGFIQFHDSISAGDDPRQNVFQVFICDDDIYEELESFTIILELDQFIPQSGVIVDPNETQVIIIDDDGNDKFCKEFHCTCTSDS
jgi:hypothetical protein